jgi:hydroxymethylpyrimidine/phosphomethylpyrimidine kinase
VNAPKRFTTPSNARTDRRLSQVHRNVRSYQTLFSKRRKAAIGKTMQPRGRVLIIAGSDSGGGAGIQADIKTVTALGGYAATAITAITVQNTLGVSAVHLIPIETIAAQARAVLGDIGADVIKTGMLGEAAVVELVAQLLDEAARPAVIDPVMVAKGGTRLAAEEALAPIRSLLVPRAALLTPNAPEAEALTGLPVETAEDLRRAGEALLKAGAGAVLMKGGHLPGERVVDVLMTPYGETSFEGERVNSRHTHGTGCTLASACAAGLAQGLSLEAATARAWAYVQEAIARAPGFGAGHGPLDHGWPLRGRA